ncbi:MAG: flagellar basal body L-ring protein FlgH [Phycisphaerae bacterium]|nr:flagellar basal body L-ring protein FlgH [Phycisphaerae bacterium]
MKIHVSLLVFCTILTAVSSAWGGSIFLNAYARTHGQSLFADDKASNIGDVLTIKISESAKVETKKNRTWDKKTANSGKGAGWFTLGDMTPGLGRIDKMWLLPEYNYGNEAKSNLTGKADTTEEQKYTDHMTVVVEDVMPNGNLLVLGKRTRSVTGNKETIQASGIVRPSDIGADNIVTSDRVANFHIVYINRGQENNYLRPGWFTRIWNLFNPF